MFNLFGNRCKTMSMRDAKNFLDHEKQVSVIDVRTQAEYAEGHIPGSIHMPLDQLPHLAGRLKDKDEKIFVYCLSGSRSQSACSFLMRQGFTDVTNIGGIMSWPGPLSSQPAGRSAR